MRKKYCNGFFCTRNSLLIINLFYFTIGLVLLGLTGYARYSLHITSLRVLAGLTFCGVCVCLLSVSGIFAALKHHQVVLFFYILVMFIIFIVQFSLGCVCLTLSAHNFKSLLANFWRNHASTAHRHRFMHSVQCCGFEDAPEYDAALSLLANLRRLGRPGSASCFQLQCCSRFLPSKSSSSKSSFIPFCCRHAIESLPAASLQANISNNTTHTASPSTSISTSSSTRISSSKHSPPPQWAALKCPCQLSCYPPMQRLLTPLLRSLGAVSLFISITQIIGVWLAIRFRNSRDPRIISRNAFF